MSGDQVGTVVQGIEPMVGAPGLTALERGLRWSVLFTVAMLPLSEAAKNIGFAVSLALYLTLLLLHDRQRPALPLVGLGLLGLFGATVLSALASEYPYPAARGVWEVFRHASFFFIALRAFRLDGDIGRFVAAIAVGTGAAALVFFYQYFLVGMPLFRFLSIGGKNASAQFLVMVLLLLLSVLAVVRVEARERWALAAAVIALLLVLGISEARTMWIAFIVLGFGLTIWLRRWWVAVAVVVLVGVVTVVAIQDQAVRERLAYLSKARNFLRFSERPVVWQQSLRIWRDHPWFGVGPRAFKIDEDVSRDPVRSRYGIEGTQGQAHNLWVHTAAEMGAVGLLALFGWMAAVGISLWSLHLIPLDPWVRALWVGTVGAFGAMMIAGVTEPAIGYEHSLLLNAELALLATTVASACGDDGLRRRKPGVQEGRR